MYPAARHATTDGHHAPPPPPPPATVPLGTCTLHDQDPSIKYSVDDILQIILRSRKSWKTLKGQSEAVWPPYLEATMLKALHEYEPDDSRETRMLGRYPMRNRFISDYIHSTTSKYRSPKQVGSRLQQLRDTPEGRELIDVLTRCYRTRIDTGTCNARVPECQPPSWVPSSGPPVSAISCDASSATSTSSAHPVTPTNMTMPRIPAPRTRQPPESRMPVYIDILPSTTYAYGHASSTSSTHQRPSDGARHIRHIDPTVTFVSPSPVNGKSSYIVLLDGAPVHSEDTALEYVRPYFSSPTGRPSGNEPLLYNTPLVPRYWDVLCAAADPALYTIVQDVYCLPHLIPGQAQRPRPTRIFSAIYHFRYSALADFTRSHESSRVGSMTSAFHDQTLQSQPVYLGQATPFAMPPGYAVPTSDGFRAPTATDQNLFDEPFMLDVTFEQLTFDDFMVGTENTYIG